MSSRANYGIDSPFIVVTLFILSGIGFGAALLWYIFRDPPRFGEIALVTAGIYFFLGAAGMLRYSKVGKLRIRDEILSAIKWCGDERALDVGCGRGLLLVGAARR